MMNVVQGGSLISTVNQLEDALSDPPEAVVETMRHMRGDLVLLGVGGKMGPSLARMARRASVKAGVNRRIIGVARFSSPKLAEQLRSWDIETISCDLLDEPALAALPDAPNILYLAGMKFGATGQEALTWAMNSYLPALVCRRYPNSRVVAFSTGNVYGLTNVNGGGSRETDVPNPVGEYAMSCLGRERIFEYFARTRGTQVSLIRLNYACDLRYGVLVDLAQKILQGAPVDLGIGYFNTIWQGDANAVTLRCFDHAASPPFVVNLTGPEKLTVRAASQKLAAALGKTVAFTGAEHDTALLSDSRRCIELFGAQSMSADELITQVATWLSRGGSTLHRPTHFESRDGKF